MSQLGHTCNCSCHTSYGGVIHFAPCCATCPHCGQDRIQFFHYDIHVEECKKTNPEPRFAFTPPDYK